MYVFLCIFVSSLRDEGPPARPFGVGGPLPSRILTFAGSPPTQTQRTTCPPFDVRSERQRTRGSTRHLPVAQGRCISPQSSLFCGLGLQHGWSLAPTNTSTARATGSNEVRDDAGECGVHGVMQYCVESFLRCGGGYATPAGCH